MIEEITEIIINIIIINILITSIQKIKEADIDKFFDNAVNILLLVI